MKEMKLMTKDELKQDLKDAGLLRPADKGETPKPRAARVKKEAAEKPAGEEQPKRRKKIEAAEPAAAGAITVTREIASILTEQVAVIEESIKALEADERRAREDLAKRRAEYEAYTNWVKSLKVSDPEKGGAA